MSTRILSIYSWPLTVALSTMTESPRLFHKKLNRNMGLILYAHRNRNHLVGYAICGVYSGSNIKHDLPLHFPINDDGVV